MPTEAHSSARKSLHRVGASGYPSLHDFHWRPCVLDALRTLECQFMGDHDTVGIKAKNPLAESLNAQVKNPTMTRANKHYAQQLKQQTKTEGQD